MTKIMKNCEKCGYVDHYYTKELGLNLKCKFCSPEQEEEA